MKRNIRLLTIILFLLSVWACQGKKQEKKQEVRQETEQKEVKFGTIDLENPENTQNLKFSQLAGNIRCIPLETTPDFIIPDNNTDLWVSDKYIITISDKDIRQFSPEGKFIRKLASSGKGPDEYIRLISYTVDEQNDIFYYGHQGDYNSIYAISLRDGQPAAKIRNTACLPAEMSVINGNIFCLPLSSVTKKLEAFLITPSGKIIDSIPDLTLPKPSGGISGPTRRTTRLLKGNKELHILKKDTVFRLNSGQLQAVAEIRLKTAPSGNISSVYQIRFKNKDYFITAKQNVENSSGSVTLHLDSYVSLITDAHTFKTTRLDKFIIDPLDQELPDVPTMYVSGGKLSCIIGTFDLKNLAKAKREAGQTLPPALQQLDAQLTEDSNPVIIVGDLK